ncbi:MAG: reverse gyrase [Desulfurococcaceae archaeon]
MNTVDPVYRNMCPLCGGDILASELRTTGSCLRCFNVRKDNMVITMAYSDLFRKEEEEFVEFFKKATNGLVPWGAQRTWVKRILSGENTVLIAPTGMGKTTLLLIYALYIAIHNKKVLYLAPTKALAKQIYQKLFVYGNNCGANNLKILFYDSSLSKKKREYLLKQIEEGDFKILVSTNSFLARRFDLLSRNAIDVILVDDVDSLIRSEKNTVKLLKLMGYDEEIIQLAKKRMNILWKLLVSQTMGNKDCTSLIKELLEIDNRINNYIINKKKVQVIIASATGRTRGIIGKVLRDLLRIDISGITIYGRDVTDSYILIDLKDIEQFLVNVIKSLGKGGIIYISPRHPYRDFFLKALNKVMEILSKNGFRIDTATPHNVIRLINGELDLLIGSSSYYGSSVRGIDAPENIRYVVFVGTPLFNIKVEAFLANPNMLIRTMMEIANIEKQNDIRISANHLRKIIYNMSPSELKIMKLCLMGKIPIDSIIQNDYLYSKFQEISKYYEEVLAKIKTILTHYKVLRIGTITLAMITDNEYVALLPDVMTYIQASGRSSRLYGNKMTHGLSIVFECKELANLIHGLETKLKTINRDISFLEFDKLNIEKELKTIDDSRKMNEGNELKYKSILVVVESPTKAKTIARFFGKPVTRRMGDVSVYEIPAKINDEIIEFNIVATKGHIFDLTTDNNGIYGVKITHNLIYPIYETIKKCRMCGTQFTTGDTCPKCKSSVYIDSKSIIYVLRKLANEVDEVYIATDPDIEGEKIAYDVYVSISSINKNIWRIELHEITPQEFLRALGKKREIDLNLVEAEIYRRVLDRLIGFSISNEIQRRYKKRYLGAGRVQTPVLGIIIERYDEYVRNKGKKAIIELGEPLNIRLGFFIDDLNSDIIKNSRTILLEKICEREVEISPKPPYSTDELLADASKLNIPVDKAMKIAQELFEAGLITYHRTDSKYISSTGISIAMKYLVLKGLDLYAKPSHWDSPGTHEAIRPTYPYDVEDLIKNIAEGNINITIPLSNLHLKIYDMIFKRFIASQMKPFKAIETTFRVKIDNIEIGEFTVFTSIIEDGFNIMIPCRVVKTLHQVDRYTAVVSSIKVIKTSKIQLYSEGEIVSLMKKLGIGRPSTYSKIISSIKRHGYVIVSKKKSKLIPTKTGKEIYRYVTSIYGELVSIEMTRRMEIIIDEIISRSKNCHQAVIEILNDLMKYGLIASYPLEKTIINTSYVF